MKQGIHSSSINKQGGVVVLAVAMIILFLITVLVFISSKSTVVSNRLSANDFRARQAFEAAETGLAYAEAFFRANGVDANGNGNLVDDIGATPTVEIFNTANNPSFSYVNDDAGNATPRYANGLSTVVYIRVLGQSDDGLASRTVDTYLNLAPALPGPPGSPLTAQGNAGALGSAKIENAFSNITAQVGGSATSGGSADTYICNNCAVTDPGTYFQNDMPADLELLEGPPTLDPNIYHNSGIDVIENDANLAGSTDNEFFNNFFEGVKDNIASYATVTGSTGFDLSQNPATSLPYGGEVIVIEGDVTINANSRIGCYEFHPTACNFTPGNPATNDIDPVVVVVLGDLQVNGTVEFYGFLYVGSDSAGNGGNITGNGNFSAWGSVALEGQVNLSGNFDLTYHPDMFIDSPAGSTAFAGSWKDW